MSNLAAGSRHDVAHRPSGVRGGESEEDTLLTTETVTAWVRAALHLDSIGSATEVTGGNLNFAWRVELPDGGRALLVGSSSGPLVSFLGASGAGSGWSRLGSC